MASGVTTHELPGDGLTHRTLTPAPVANGYGGDVRWFAANDSTKMTQIA